MLRQVLIIDAVLSIAQVNRREAGRNIGTLVLGTVMRHETQPVLLIVMHGVVTNIQGQTHDEERSLTFSEEHHALRAVLQITDVLDVVGGADLQPSPVEHEVEVRRLILELARDVYTLALNVLLTLTIASLNIDGFQVVIKEPFRELDCGRRRVENGVRFSRLDVVSLQVWHSVVVQKGAKCETLAASRPEQVIFQLDVHHFIRIFH